MDYSVPWTPVEDAVARASQARDRRLLRSQPDFGRSRGVVHTPVPLARGIVARVDRLLRERLDRRYGLADPAVAVVDPACGPGNFLAALFAVARGPGPHRWLGMDIDPLAVRVATEVLTPEAGSRRISLELRVANALSDIRPFGSVLSNDMLPVVIGNPPWAGRTANRDTVTSALLEDFRRDRNGERLPERKIGVLSDDYVRFFRWAAEIVRGHPAGGVVAFLTNASFLDGPVHRGMRGALARWFDGIEVMDLGGGSLVARRSRVDENVFGVRPPVAFTLAWRRGGHGSGSPRATYRRLWGTRSEKWAQLAELDDVPTETLELTEPRYPFRPEVPVPPIYWEWPALDQVMPFHREGVQTNRDLAATDVSRSTLLRRLNAFSRGDTTDPRLQAAFRASPHYCPDRARSEVRRALASGGSPLRPLAYRPGEVRWFAPITRFCHRPRPKLAHAVARSNLVLITVRKDRGDLPWTHAAVTRAIPDNCFLSTRSACRARAFPDHDPDGRQNLSEMATRELSSRLGRVPNTRDWVAYVAAFLVSPSYRRIFDSALRQDYPRLPWPASSEVFTRIGKAGEAVCQAFLSLDSECGGPPETLGHEVAVGHFRVRSSALAAAVEEAERAILQEIPRPR